MGGYCRSPYCIYSDFGRLLLKRLNSLISLWQSFCYLRFVIDDFLRKRFKIRVYRNCIFCNQWVQFSAPLCRHCRRFIYKSFRENIHEVYLCGSVRVFFLWKWSNHQPWVRQLILSLKDGNQPALYHLFMKWMAYKIKFHLFDVCVEGILPIPSSKRKHPEVLAKTFQKIIAPCEGVVLHKVNDKQQKFLNKFQRNQISFSITHEDQVRKVKDIWVVDDILVTGSSIRSAQKTISWTSIKYGVVWAIHEDLYL